MTDLTKIDKPFGELDRETQLALFEAWLDGAEVDCLADGIWYRTNPVSWRKSKAYRIATTPDTIDWDHVAPQAKFMARGESGSAWLFDCKPSINDAGDWDTVAEGDCVGNADTFASYRRGTCDWKDSLVERPEA